MTTGNLVSSQLVVNGIHATVYAYPYMFLDFCDYICKRLWYGIAPCF